MSIILSIFLSMLENSGRGSSREAAPLKSPLENTDTCEQRVYSPSHVKICSPAPAQMFALFRSTVATVKVHTTERQLPQGSKTGKICFHCARLPDLFVVLPAICESRYVCTRMYLCMCGHWWAELKQTLVIGAPLQGKAINWTSVITGAAYNYGPRHYLHRCQPSGMNYYSPDGHSHIHALVGAANTQFSFYHDLSSSSVISLPLSVPLSLSLN